MKAWLSRYNADLFFAPDSPEELARYELSVALPHTGGSGTLLHYTLGAICMLLAGALLAMRQLRR